MLDPVDNQHLGQRKMDLSILFLFLSREKQNEKISLIEKSQIFT
jgi:hypothetical protein